MDNDLVDFAADCAGKTSITEAGRFCGADPPSSPEVPGQDSEKIPCSFPLAQFCGNISAHSALAPMKAASSDLSKAARRANHS